jgi:hypothetical protein
MHVERKMRVWEIASSVTAIVGAVTLFGVCPNSFYKMAD